jgi:hydrogenase/urease accessory protein HupE
MKTKLGIFSLTILTAATIAGTAQAHSGPGLMEGHLHLFWGIDQLGLLLAIGLSACLIAASLRSKLSGGKCLRRVAHFFLRGRT